jgi:surface carbohydrate biosynthesis protein
MIIYFPLEIKAREFPGYLVAAIFAASRGHEIFIGSSTEIFLHHRLGLLKKGAYLIKNTNVPNTALKIYKTFQNSGFDLYCCDQEPSILWKDFERYLYDYNITKEQPIPFKGVFCWGERDTNGYKDFFPNQKDVFVNTGSYRTDLWSKQYKNFHSAQNPLQDRDYILMISNFGLLMGSRHWSRWMESAKANEILKSMQQEDAYIDYIEEDQEILLLFIKAIRVLANKFPKRKIVVRPHPHDDPKTWERVSGDYSNIHIADNHSSLGVWITNASVVIQNGCTSALETVIHDKPLINLGKKRVRADLVIPSMLGLQVDSIDELEQAIKICENSDNYQSTQQSSEKILKPLLSMPEKGSASMIIKIIEQRSSQYKKFDSYGLLHILIIKIIGSSKGLIDKIRTNIFRQELPKPNYLISKEEVAKELSLLSQTMNLPVPNITKISSSAILIKHK